MALSWLFALLLVASDGFNVQHASVRVEVGGDYELHLYAPECAGLFPVIFFVSGVSGDVPVSMYSDLLTRIVAEGYIVAGFDHLAFPSYPKQGQQFHDLLEWSKTGLVVAMRNQSLAATPDVLDRAAVMGQSAGNHIVGQGLVDGCSVAKALIMIDPVDGTDPFHIITSEDLITVGSKLPFTIPSLLLDNTLDPTGKFFGAAVCAVGVGKHAVLQRYGWADLQCQCNWLRPRRLRERRLLRTRVEHVVPNR